MQKITPFFWFDNNLEEAINFYTGIFKNSKVKKTSRLPPGVPGEEEKLFTATFELDGLEFIGLCWNGAKPFNDAISFVVNCDTQQEVDYYWDKLTADGGTEVQCGWLKDKFGVSWQITPLILGQLMSDPDATKANRVMQAMMKMVKLDIETLKKAYDGD